MDTVKTSNMHNASAAVAEQPSESTKTKRGGGEPVWNPITAPDTGSFVATADETSDSSPAFVRPVKAQHQADGATSIDDDHPLKRYTVDEVMDAYPQEPPEETLLMNRIENQQALRQNHHHHHHQHENDYPMSEIPTVLSELAMDQMMSSSSIHDDKMKDHQESSAARADRPEPAGTGETFGEIAKKLLDGTPAGQLGGSQAAPNAGNNGRPPAKNMHRRKATMDGHAGDKLYEAAETLFGQYADPTTTTWGASEATNDEISNPSPVDTGAASSRSSKRSASRSRRRLLAFRKKAREDLAYFVQFLGPHRVSLQKEFFGLARWIMIPSLAAATIMYYGFENPPTGYNHNDEEDGSGTVAENVGDGNLGTNVADDMFGINDAAVVGPVGNDNPASLSWWFIFCGVRQVITLELARLSQLIVIDFFTLRTRTFPKVLGPNMALLVAQAKGFPCILTCWAFWDLALLYGDRRFSRHWAYWQEWIGMFNDTNPDGDITSADTYIRLIYSALLVGIVVSIKRAIMGQIVGKRVVRNYRGDLAQLMKKLILMNDVSHLSMQREARTQYGGDFHRFDQFDEGRSKEMRLSVDMKMLDSNDKDQAGDSFDYSDALSVQSREKKKLTASAHLDIMELLEEWEEPELQGGDEEVITVGTILQFRRALEFIRTEYPFSPAFGSVRTRENCVTSAQKVFERLMQGNPGPFLEFEVLCLIAKDFEGNVDRGRVRELIRVFRPNRNGQLSKLDFVKSVDSIYKSLRLLLASIRNSQQIDKAYESLVNIAFAAILGFIVLAIVGVDIQALVVGLGSLIVSFAFMIGSASSKYLEGILFVLVRKPYDIGDRVNIDEVAVQPDKFGGDSSWIIENVDLYTTTARVGTTRELATFANGSLAGMRVMNLNRSDKPNVFLNLKFSVDSTLQQRKMFKLRMTAFVKERPREWIRVVDFRSTRVEADLGFVEYVLVLQHREKWQNLGAILSSRGHVFNHAVELQKELDMKYKAPHVPVDIRRIKSEPSPRGRSLLNDGSNGGGSSDDDTTDDLSFIDEPKKER